eukprot:CAMPEP_0194179228 /NCGR_PEP_ID=MMETSP0154-20130528/12731_1 /TAXON_ID=1049557 /ORGANISM="Thalassiothrix antarctica, Strain L6-D1" /LENGTH=684 /DNA_ID=CAMNT_0038894519 /DNA_START=265 /DNA_END=2319 /DNA_ORIENTATION=-
MTTTSNNRNVNNKMTKKAPKKLSTRSRSVGFSEVPHSPITKYKNNRRFSMQELDDDGACNLFNKKEENAWNTNTNDTVSLSPQKRFSSRARSNSLSEVPHSPMMKYNAIEERDLKADTKLQLHDNVAGIRTNNRMQRRLSGFLPELAPPMPTFAVSRALSMSSVSMNGANVAGIRTSNRMQRRLSGFLPELAPPMPKLGVSRALSMSSVSMNGANNNQVNCSNSRPRQGTNRRGSLVPLELRHSNSIGSHRRSLPAVLPPSKSLKQPPSTQGSCDDGWTPLGLEFFVAELTVPPGNIDAEDWHSVQWLNRAARKYETVGHNDEAELEEVQRLLCLAKTTTSFFAGARDSNLGVVLFRLGRTREALERFESANYLLDFPIPIQDAAAGESIYLRVAAMLNLARTLVRFNQVDATRQRCHQIIEVVKEFIDSHPTQFGISYEIQNQVRWLGVVAQYYVMGMVYQRTGDLPKALDLYTTILNKARHDLGHSHVHVATLLYMKGMIFFDQQKLHQAMLAQLGSLRIYDMLDRPNIRELARVLYSIGRTLHDREDYQDALRMYQRTLFIQKQINPSAISTVTTMCNIARVHHITGDVDAALRENEDIVLLAEKLARGKPHPFWANRLVVLGNIYVEIGLYDKAMKSFDKAVSKAGGGEQVFVGCPFDVDARLASSLAKAGLQHPCAAMA